MAPKTEPVVYNVQLVGDSMLLRMSKFLERFTRSADRPNSRWGRHSPRTALRSRSSSTPRQKMNVSARGQTGGSLTDIFTDSSATNADCDTYVPASPVSHLYSGSGGHWRSYSATACTSIDKSPMTLSNETSTKVSMNNSPKSIPRDTVVPKNNSPSMISNDTSTPVSMYKSAMMLSNDPTTPVSKSMYKSYQELSKSLPIPRHQGYHLGTDTVPEIISLCVSGQTLSQLYALLESFATKRCVDMSQNVLLMCGTNDIKRGTGIFYMERTMIKIIQLLKGIRSGVNVTVLTLPPIPALDSPQQTSTLLQYNKFLQEKLEGVKVLDIYPLFMAQEKILNNLFEEFLGNRIRQKKDGVHWNARGMNVVHQFLLQRGIFQR